LWQDLEAQWRRDEAAIVWPNLLAEERFLRQALQQESLLGKRTMTVDDLWRRVGEAAGVREIKRDEVKSKVASLLAGEDSRLESLRRGWSPDDLDTLVRHLEAVEEREGYEPTTAVERAVLVLCDELEKQGGPTIVRHRYRNHVPFAKGLTLEHPLILAPLGTPDLRLIRLLSSLAASNDITVYLLTSAVLEEEALEPYRYASGGELNLESHLTAARWPAGLFAGASAARKKPPARWVEADSELEAAVDVACRWVAAGTKPEDIAIAFQSADAYGARLEWLASRRGLPISMRHQLGVRDTQVGSLLLRLVEADLSAEPERMEFLESEGEQTPLTLGDLEAIASSRQLGVETELQALHALGMRLLGDLPESGLMSDAQARAGVWLDALKAATQVIPVGTTALEVVETARSRRQLRGDDNGVAIISYPETPSFRPQRLILCSLSGGEYPSLPQRSPFVSAELAAQEPHLGVSDQRPEFTAAVLAAAEEVVFVRGATSRSGEKYPPSIYWEETRRVAAELELGTGVEQWASGHHSTERRRLLQRSARERVLLGDELKRIHETVSAERLPAGAFGGERAEFSVTELEQYLSCPYGWFVRYVLGVRDRQGWRAWRGDVAHGALEDALAVPLEERSQALKDSLRARGDGRLTALELTLFDAWLETISHDYGDLIPDAEHYFEMELQSAALEGLGDGVLVKGRADRVDIGAEVLIVDYKTRRRPAPSESKAHQLQRYLYPLMAAGDPRAKGAPPLGMVYVALLSGEHEGTLLHPLDTLPPNGKVSYNWEAESQAALGAAAGAVEGILNAQVSVGSHCKDYCPHYALSQTIGPV
jgi:hypothetical protein